jgi:CheY-like chemotaxis protein
MAGETLEKAVEPFFTTKGVGHGTGLGLSMAHGLMAQLGGKLEVRSKVGEGTSVALWLPQSDQPLPPISKVNPQSRSIETRTVLLVDDDKLVRASTSELLRDIGYKVKDVGSGEEAISLWKAGYRPQIIVTDFRMGGIDGLELAQTIRQESPSQRIVIASGYADIDFHEKGFPTIAKPFRQSDLRRVLEDL